MKNGFGKRMFGMFAVLSAFFAGNQVQSIPVPAFVPSKYRHPGKPKRISPYWLRETMLDTSNMTFKRIKKVRNFFVYGWVENKKTVTAGS